MWIQPDLSVTIFGVQFFIIVADLLCSTNPLRNSAMTQFPNSLGVTKTMRSISQPMGTYRKAPMLVLWSVIACLSAMSTDAWVTQANAQATDPSGQNSGGQSFSFGFGGASAGFSFGGGKPNELRSPGETDSSSTPSSRSNSFRSGMSKTMTNVNGNIVEKSVEDRDGVMTSTVRIKNKKQDVLIEESDEIGIRVTITETVRGKEKKTEHQAD